MSRFTSRPVVERRLSIEETYALADAARRKSSSTASRKDLRMQLGHAHMLEALEYAIRTSPPPSPQQKVTVPASEPCQRSTELLSPPTLSGVDEYGFPYDDGEEDYGSLSLVRTESRCD